jgi:hypothetical protein
MPEHLRLSVVHDWELDNMEVKYVADRATYEFDLRRAISQVRFLERLRGEDGSGGGGGGGGAGGRGSHSSASQLNLSRVRHKKSPYTP